MKWKKLSRQDKAKFLLAETKTTVHNITVEDCLIILNTKLTCRVPLADGRLNFQGANDVTPFMPGLVPWKAFLK